MKESGYIQIEAKHLRFGEVFTAGPFNHEIIGQLIRAEISRGDGAKSFNENNYVFAVSNTGNVRTVYVLSGTDLATVWR
jgi:hypothetical protein